MIKVFILLLAVLPIGAAHSQEGVPVFAADEYIRIYNEEIAEAMKYAPPDKSKYQLRGDAQKRAQSLLDDLEKKHGYPHYTLPGIMFRPVLVDNQGRVGAAGLSNGCDYPPYSIQLNEILFYRNYDEFMRMVIAHEVAHVASCLKRKSNDGDEHGQDWEDAMRAMGFLNPQNEVTHTLDMAPVQHYRERIGELLKSVFE